MSDQPPPDLVTAAESGNAEAQCDLGRFLAKTADPNQAARARQWFERAAAQGLARAKHNLGVLAFNAGDRDEARRWLEAAAQDGWLQSQLAIAALHEEDGDNAAAKAAYEPAARAGSVEAQAALGRLLHAEDTPDAHRAALVWCHQAAENGHAGAMVSLGMLYNEGVAQERDQKRSFEWFLAGAREGHGGGQMSVGTAYQVGNGVAADQIEAMAWFMLSTMNGHALGRIMLDSLDRRLGAVHRAEVEQRVAAIRAEWPRVLAPVAVRLDAAARPPHLKASLENQKCSPSRP